MHPPLKHLAQAAGGFFRLVIGCRNEDPQASPEDKWYFAHDTQTGKCPPENTALFYLDYVANYRVGSIDPEWRFWVKYGFVDGLEPGQRMPFVNLISRYGKEEVVEFMKSCMTRRQLTLNQVKLDPNEIGPNERPMPGARPNPTIKDIKGERLS